MDLSYVASFMAGLKLPGLSTKSSPLSNSATHAPRWDWHVGWAHKMRLAMIVGADRPFHLNHVICGHIVRALSSSSYNIFWQWV
jgi:hypothetical protein